MIIDLAAAVRIGLYVVEFPDRPRPVATLPACVKIGRSINVLNRIATHGRDGGVRAWLSPPLSELGAVMCERRALRVACERVGREYEPRGSEHFVGLSFMDAIEIVQEVVDHFVEPNLEAVS